MTFKFVLITCLSLTAVSAACLGEIEYTYYYTQECVSNDVIYNVKWTNYDTQRYSVCNSYSGDSTKYECREGLALVGESTKRRAGISKDSQSPISDFKACAWDCRKSDKGCYGSWKADGGF